MLNWHWLHPDFVAAHRACTDPEEWAAVYEQHYLRPHAEQLYALHYQPKGFGSPGQVLDRVTHLGFAHYTATVERILTSQGYEGRIEQAVRELLVPFGTEPVTRDVYSIIGLDCTNIYSLPYGNQHATVVCLEAVEGCLPDLEHLFAHEVHHWFRQDALGPDVFTVSVGERLITEGLAIAYSAEFHPDLAPWNQCFVSAETYRWTEEHWRDLIRVIEHRAAGPDDLDALFSRKPQSMLLPGMPPRTGYVLAYFVVRRYLAGRSAAKFASVPWTLAWDALS